MGFLQRFGYLEGQSTNNSEALLREEAVIDAVRTMQRFGGLSPTGSIDNDTLLVIQIWILLYITFFINSARLNSCWRLLVAVTKMWNWTMNRVEEGGKDLWSEHLVGTNEKSPICKCITIFYCIFHLLSCFCVKLGELESKDWRRRNDTRPTPKSIQSMVWLCPFEIRPGPNSRCGHCHPFRSRIPRR